MMPIMLWLWRLEGIQLILCLAARAEDHLLEWEEARRELESSKRTIFDLTRMIKRVKRQQMRLVDAIIDSCYFITN